MNLQDHIGRYLDLVGQAEALFQTVQRSHQNLMACRAGCDDCCHVYFKVSLIEAFVISGMFRQNLSNAAQERALARSEKAGPLFHEAETLLLRPDSAEKGDILEIASKIRIPCPLNEDHTCILYAHRPITCRLYGTPQKIGDRVVSCPKCGFSEGSRYITVDVNEIQRKLYEYSRELLKDLIGIDVPAPGPGYSLPETVRTVFDKNFFLTLRDSL